MYIVIDNSSAEKIILHYNIQTRSHRRDFSLTGEGGVVVSIEALLNELHASLTSLTGVAVVVGHGRWTAIRVAVVVANSLAYTLGIPVVAVSSSDEINEVFVKLSKQPIGQYVLPAYNGEARIGAKSGV